MSWDENGRWICELVCLDCTRIFKAYPDAEAGKRCICPRCLKRRAMLLTSEEER